MRSHRTYGSARRDARKGVPHRDPITRAGESAASQIWTKLQMCLTRSLALLVRLATPPRQERKAAASIGDL